VSAKREDGKVEGRKDGQQAAQGCL
jgi:hypothetical protein